ncbi:MAG: hypothetical protein JWO53_955 [Chlamydiia bacterium]|nr:hypothetical protein [Chlamydiia bacterium]
MKKPVEFAIVVPSYNNASWLSNNLHSIAEQTYPHFHLYYINDASTDDTGELAKLLVAQPGLQGKTTLIHNKERQGSLCNLYTTIHQIDPHMVVVTIDGDDWLSHPQVLEKVAAEYRDESVWMTYGNFESDPPGWRPSQPVLQSTYRNENGNWIIHLRTFYARLFQLIKREDLQYNGHFFPIAGDLAFLFPMFEMAHENHSRFINDVLYIYNIQNPLNDFRLHSDAQGFMELVIRERPQYKPLQKLFE